MIEHFVTSFALGLAACSSVINFRKMLELRSMGDKGFTNGLLMAVCFLSIFTCVFALGFHFVEAYNLTGDE